MIGTTKVIIKKNIQMKTRYNQGIEQIIVCLAHRSHHNIHFKSWTILNETYKLPFFVVFTKWKTTPLTNSKEFGIFIWIVDKRQTKRQQLERPK